MEAAKAGRISARDNPSNVNDSDSDNLSFNGEDQNFEGLCEDLLKKFDKSGKPNVRKVYQADKTASKVAFIDYINETFVPQSQRKAIPRRQVVVEDSRWL